VPENVFTDIELYPGLRKALDDQSLLSPTPVQAQAVPAALAGRDLLVSALTGTGKTLAYLIPIVQRLATEKPPKDAAVLGLILVPTRELARQVLKQAQLLTASTPLNTLLITGGESLNFQKAELRKNPEIVVATPGRLLEVLKQDSVALAGLRMLVLDEADRVLEMGFGEDVETIARAANPDRQTLMLSATLGRAGLRGLSRNLMKDPQVIHLGRDEQPAIDHRLMLADDRSHKNDLLVWLLKNETYQRALVFANTRDNAERIYTLVRAQGHEAGVLHGDKPHDMRKKILERFRQGASTVMVASDVAARGLDIPEVELVINYDMPRKGTDYTHRVGRTGRAGREGVAVSLVEPGEWNLMASIQRFLKLEFRRVEAEGLVGRFKGPKNLKSSGRAAGKKKNKGTNKGVRGKKAASRGKKPAKKTPARAPKSAAESGGNRPLRKKRRD
jgi:ATP-dependent RNA helicase SrmB